VSPLQNLSTDLAEPVIGGAIVLRGSEPYPRHSVLRRDGVDGAGCCRGSPRRQRRTQKRRPTLQAQQQADRDATRNTLEVGPHADNTSSGLGSTRLLGRNYISVRLSSCWLLCPGLTKIGPLPFRLPRYVNASVTPCADHSW
jgi:hypothetical protein